MLRVVSLEPVFLCVSGMEFYGTLDRVRVPPQLYPAEAGPATAPQVVDFSPESGAEDPTEPSRAFMKL